MRMPCAMAQQPAGKLDNTIRTCNIELRLDLYASIDIDVQKTVFASYIPQFEKWTLMSLR